MTDQQTIRFSGKRRSRGEPAGQEQNARKRAGIPGELYDDEVVCFIAHRYRTTPRNILQCFFVQDGVQKYKQGTLHIVKLLLLLDQMSLNPANKINNFIQ